MAKKQPESSKTPKDPKTEAPSTPSQSQPSSPTPYNPDQSPYHPLKREPSDDRIVVDTPESSTSAQAPRTSTSVGNDQSRTDWLNDQLSFLRSRGDLAGFIQHLQKGAKARAEVKSRIAKRYRGTKRKGKGEGEEEENEGEGGDVAKEPRRRGESSSGDEDGDYDTAGFGKSRG